MGLTTSPWLKGLKQAVLQDAPDDTPILLDDGSIRPVGKLRDTIIDVTPGYKAGNGYARAWMVLPGGDGPRA